ncbi:MAG: hypothetical protein ACYCZR_14675 [Burkholderiales bacterium]
MMPPSGSMQQMPTHDIDGLMQYYEQLEKLPASGLATEYRNTSLAYSKTGSDSSRMRLALLLWLPGTPFRNPGAALDLLKARPILDPGLRSFADLLGTLLAEQQNSDNAQHHLEQMLKEEKKHSSVLQDKIDAVKKMEKALIHMEKQ